MSAGVFVDQIFAEAIRPIPRLTVSQWAEKYRVLTSVASAEPGPWKNSRTPYLREIMDRLSSHDDAQFIIVKKGSQVGMTEAGFNAIGYFIDVDPCPMLYAMPTEAGAKKNSNTRFDPMVRGAKSLAEKIPVDGSKKKNNSILLKQFPGGVLVFCGTNSAAPLRSMPARVIVLDEVDNMPVDVDGEGSPIDLAIARTRTFSRKKIFILSTPTTEGASMITSEFENTAQKKYFVPCPHCGLYQTLEWEQVRWDPGQPDSANYLCSGCDENIAERHKPFMLKNGEWRDTVPEKASAIRVGYFISALYSPLGWYSWANAVDDYEKAVGKPEKEKVFFNTVLGETYQEKGDAPEWQNLFERRENYPTYRPPKEVVLLTAGVDVQKDRIELEILGWGKGKETWSVDYRVLVGDTDSTGPGSAWAQLGKMIDEPIVRVDGKSLPVMKWAIDTGYNTQEAYSFCRSFDPVRVVPIKGQANQATVLTPPRPVDRQGIKGKVAGSLGLWNIGANILKSQVYGFLRQKLNEDGSRPPGYCHFPSAYDEHYFKMLTAEQLQKKIINGYPKFEWVKTQPRNEALDCRIYAMAAGEMLGVSRFQEADWEALNTMYLAKVERPKESRERRSSIWD